MNHTLQQGPHRGSRCRAAAITGDDLATCRRFSDALANGDLDAAVAEAHEQIELCTPCGDLHGAAGLRTFLAGARLEHFEQTIIVEGVVADGARAFALGRIELRWRDGGDLADSRRVGALLEVRDGRVIRWQSTPDVESARERLADQTATRQRHEVAPERPHPD